MGIYRDFIVLVVGILVIIKSADFFTHGAEGIARIFRIPRLIIGLTIVSIATTAPEFTISTISSYMKSGGIAVGNALGSCIANIGLILGVAAILHPIDFKKRTIRQDIPLLFLVLAIFTLLVVNGELSRLDGAFLVLLLVIFLVFVVIRELRGRADNKTETGDGGYSIGPCIIKFAIGAAGVILAAKYAIIPSSVNIARFFGVPEVVIGLSMVALGTSLPELTTALVASVKKMGELAVGNVIGANILNILWVLGASSMIRPLGIDPQIKTITIPVIFGITLLMFLFSATKLKISRREGVALLAVYVGYIIYIFNFAYS